MGVEEQKTPKEQKKVTGKIILVENSYPCCMPGYCDNNSSSK